MTVAQQRTVPRDQWLSLSREYHNRVQKWTVPFRQRRKVGQSHPVHDFLFVYYQYSPAKLEHWHPGIGVLLENANERPAWMDESDYATSNNCLFLDPRKLSQRLAERLIWILEMLTRTQEREPHFSCFGLHEWAMVYQGEEVRHEKSTPFRLPQVEIDRVVEGRPLTCTHFDAYRFFADSAKPKNRITPTMDDRIVLEQPACIHANMDLYKWAYKSMPWIGSDLLWQCFELAMTARVIDMRASPYDLSAYEILDSQENGSECQLDAAFNHFAPIPVETPAGRREYELAQRELYSRGLETRGELISKLQSLLNCRVVVAES
ncbi:MAG: 3-methyladenine DNA glycosylase [Planctomycetota bacterium]